MVEIFLDADRSGHDYYELEISPANVVCDLRMIVALALTRRATYDWNLAGLETRVRPAKDAAGRATGWTATAFLPWKGLRALPSAARGRRRRPGRAIAGASTCSASSGLAGKADPEKDAVQVALVEAVARRRFHDPSVFRDMVFLGAAR